MLYVSSSVRQSAALMSLHSWGSGSGHSTLHVPHRSGHDSLNNGSSHLGVVPPGAFHGLHCSTFLQSSAGYTGTTASTEQGEQSARDGNNVQLACTPEWGEHRCDAQGAQGVQRSATAKGAADVSHRTGSIIYDFKFHGVFLGNCGE